MPVRSVRGRLRLPGDKSISHRYAMLAALADGQSTISRYAPGADCAATLACLRALGVRIARVADPAGAESVIQIIGRGVRGLSAPSAALDARNSGTTLRLLAGIVAAHPFESTIDGDASLRRRPMRRVIEPLERMGARVRASNDRAPLTIVGGPLRGIEHQPETPSAQVKSAVLLAGLQASGRTRVIERVCTRTHTELALRAFGASIDCRDGAIDIEGGQRLRGGALHVPGDLSSAVFWAVAAAGLPGSRIELEDVGLNPSRTAVLDVLRDAGADLVAHVDAEEAGEPRGRLVVAHRGLRAVTIAPAQVPSLIDELPALAALATCGGDLRVTGASELRLKESDRIGALAAGLQALGGDVEELPDGVHVRGGSRLAGGTADAAGDHRLAMAFAVAALGALGPSVILGAEAVEVSYPGFFEVLESLTG